VATPRVIQIGAPTHGLTDFPERATPEHSTQALNVEFSGGGAASRRGTLNMQNSFYVNGGAQASTVKLVKSFRLGTNKVQSGVVGLVPLAGAAANAEILIVREQANFGGGFGGMVGNVELTAANAETNESAGSRWDACVFDRRLIVCTDHDIRNTATVFYSDPRANRMFALSGDTGPINRTLEPFHQGGGEGADSPYSDDPGNYAVMAEDDISARFCRSQGGRLILGNLRDIKIHGNQISPSAIWYSNLLDVRGWPIDNVHVPTGGDTGPVTGLASRGDHTVVFREGSISLFRVEGPYRTTYRQVVNDRGCIAHSTIVDDAGGMACFLAGDGFYGFDGRTTHHLSAPISRTMQAAIEGGGVGGAHAIHYPKKRQIWLAMPDKGGAPRRVFVMDYRFGYKGDPAWSIFEFQNSTWGHAATRRGLGGFCTNDAGTKLYGVTVDNNGLVDYNLFDHKSAQDDQENTPFVFRSRWESGPVGYNSNSIYRWRFIRPMIRPTMDNDLDCWWRTDEQAFNADGSLNGQSVTFAPDDGGAAGGNLGAFVLGTDRLGESEDHSKRLDVHSGGICRYGRIGVQTRGGAGGGGNLGDQFDVRSAEIDVLARRRVRR